MKQKIIKILVLGVLLLCPWRSHAEVPFNQDLPSAASPFYDHAEFNEWGGIATLPKLYVFDEDEEDEEEDPLDPFDPDGWEQGQSVDGPVYDSYLIILVFTMIYGFVIRRKCRRNE